MFTILFHFFYFLVLALTTLQPTIRLCIIQSAEYRKLKLLIDAGIESGTVTKDRVDFGKQKPIGTDNLPTLVDQNNSN